MSFSGHCQVVSPRNLRLPPARRRPSRPTDFSTACHDCWRICFFYTCMCRLWSECWCLSFLGRVTHRSETDKNNGTLVKHIEVNNTVILPFIHHSNAVNDWVWGWLSSHKIMQPRYHQDRTHTSLINARHCYNLLYKGKPGCLSIINFHFISKFHGKDVLFLVPRAARALQRSVFHLACIGFRWDWDSSEVLTLQGGRRVLTVLTDTKNVWKTWEHPMGTKMMKHSCRFHDSRKMMYL